MTDRLDAIQARLAPLRAALVEHPIYREIDRLAALQTFMAHHVFAVWDFMSLLKALQQRLCCVTIPWTPAVDGGSSRLVNQIVLAEESDDDGHGGFASHFEMYRRAMIRCGASTAGIDGFIAAVRRGQSVAAALDAPGVPACAGRFVRHTFEVIEGGELCAIAAAFTFGREDLLPAVFRRMVEELNAQAGGQLEDFKYYLHRHIDLDGDEHGPMAHRLVETLCGDDAGRWRIAEETAAACLEARRRLWDGIRDAIQPDRGK